MYTRVLNPANQRSALRSVVARGTFLTQSRYSQGHLRVTSPSVRRDRAPSAEYTRLTNAASSGDRDATRRFCSVQRESAHRVRLATGLEFLPNNLPAGAFSCQRLSRCRGLRPSPNSKTGAPPRSRQKQRLGPAAAGAKRQLFLPG
jgi:hypothetical protein